MSLKDIQKYKQEVIPCLLHLSPLLLLFACNANLINPINNNSIQLKPNISVHLDGKSIPGADVKQTKNSDVVEVKERGHQISIKTKLPSNNSNISFEYIRIRVMNKSGQVVDEKKIKSTSEIPVIYLPENTDGLLFFAEAINEKHLRVLEAVESNIENLAIKKELTLNLQAVDIRLAIFDLPPKKWTPENKGLHLKRG